MVLDLEATNQMDTTTAERLSALLASLRSRGIDLHLVRVFGNVREVLGRSGFIDELGPDHVWHSIAAGVKAARHAPAFAWAEDADLDESAEGEHIASRREGNHEGLDDVTGCRPPRGAGHVGSRRAQNDVMTVTPPPPQRSIVVSAAAASWRSIVRPTRASGRSLPVSTIASMAP